MTVYRLAIKLGNESRLDHLYLYPDMAITALERHFERRVPDALRSWHGDVLVQQRVQNFTVRLEPLHVFDEGL